MTTSRNARPTRTFAGAVAAFVAVVLAAGGLAVPAGASALHGGEARVDVLEVQPEPGGVGVAVRITYVNDGHGAPDATVAVAGESGEAVLTPVNLSPTGEEGVYAGTVPTPGPGSWTLRVSSIEPTATAEVVTEVPAVPIQPITADTAGTAVVDTAPPTEPPPAGAPPPGAPGTPAESSGTGSTPVWVWILGALAVVVAVGLGAVFVRQGARPGPID